MHRSQRQCKRESVKILRLACDDRRRMSQHLILISATCSPRPCLRGLCRSRKWWRYSRWIRGWSGKDGRVGKGGDAGEEGVERKRLTALSPESSFWWQTLQEAVVAFQKEGNCFWEPTNFKTSPECYAWKKKRISWEHEETKLGPKYSQKMTPKFVVVPRRTNFPPFWTIAN